MSLINVKNLTFGYDGAEDNIFENVSFQLDTDWRLGFTGRNGRGKTTFLRLLMGEMEYRGSISASVDFEYFPYAADSEMFTIDVIRDIAANAEDWQINRELSLLGVSDEVLWRQFGTLSKGEQTKAMLAGMFLRENAFLLIDEPTNHLDEDGRRKVADYLHGKKGFILVSHDRDFLDRCIDHVLSVNRCNIEVQKGSFSSWLRNKELQDSFEISQNKKLSREIKSLESAAKKAAAHSRKIESTKIGFDPANTEKTTTRRASIAAKSKKLMNRSKAIESRIESDISEKSKLLKNIENSEELKISPLKFHSSRILQLENVGIHYGEKIVCDGVSFAIESGERIALKGTNGCGKSSVLKLICGEDIEYTGRLIKSGQLKISYVPQSAEHLCGSLSDYCEKRQIDGDLLRAILRKLDFSREQFGKNMENYSGGQKKKVLLAASLCEQAHLYIWDEPLNFIDVLSRIQIENLLDRYRPTLLFVEHDAAFCSKIADRTVEIGGNKNVTK